MKRVHYVVLSFAVASCLAALSWMAAGRTVAADPKGSDAKVEQPKVEVQILDYDHIIKTIASHQGRIVVVDCWSTSCVPCMKEFHNLVEIHKEYDADNVACLSLCFDYSGVDDPKELVPPVIEFLQKEGATFENILSSDSDETLYKKFEMNSVPTVLVYGRDGKLAKKFDDNSKRPDGKKGFSYEQVKKLVAEFAAKPNK